MRTAGIQLTPKVWEFTLEYLNNAFIWDTKCLLTVWQLIRGKEHLTLAVKNVYEGNSWIMSIVKAF